MKKLALAAVISACLSLPTVTMAFGLPGLGGGSTQAASSGDLNANQDTLVKNYVAANKDVLFANAYMAEALGLKTEAATAKAQAQALTEGATKGNLQAANKEVSTSSSAVAKALESGPVLDEAAKKLYAEGLSHLGKGVLKYVNVGGEVKKMATGLSGASPLEVAKLDRASYVVSNFPDSLSEVSKALSASVKFAQDAGIPVPADATDALSAL